jgi:hypothetical protein
VFNVSKVGPKTGAYLRLCGYSIREIARWTSTTRLLHDLNIYGDKADDDLEVMRDECGVSFENFQFSRYFPEEFSLHAHVPGYRGLLRAVGAGRIITRVYATYDPLCSTISRSH